MKRNKLSKNSTVGAVEFFSSFFSFLFFFCFCCHCLIQIFRPIVLPFSLTSFARIHSRDLHCRHPPLSASHWIFNMRARGSTYLSPPWCFNTTKFLPLFRFVFCPFLSLYYFLIHSILFAKIIFPLLFILMWLVHFFLPASSKVMCINKKKERKKNKTDSNRKFLTKKKLQWNKFTHANLKKITFHFYSK